MQKFKTQTAIILLASIFVLLLQPAIVSAQYVGSNEVQSKLYGGSSTGEKLLGVAICGASGLIATWVTDQIRNAITNIASKFFLSASGWLQKLGGNLFQWANNSVPSNDAAMQNKYTTKTMVLDLISRCFARQYLNDMTGRMIGAARTSGKNGGPSFVRHWRQFLTNAEYRGENVFRSILYGTTMCPYFSSAMKTFFNANNQPDIRGKVNLRVGNLDPFTLRGRCTMPRNWAMQNYVKDFAGNGGYSTLVQLAEPQNNPYGMMLMSLGELAAQSALEQSGDSSDALANNGFTSRLGGILKTVSGSCNRTTKYCSNIANKVCASDSDCAVRDTCRIRAITGACIIDNDILTPGSVLGNAVNGVIKGEVDYLTNIHTWQELIQYMMTTTMSRILDLSKPTKYSQEPFGEEFYQKDPHKDPNPDFDTGGNNDPGPNTVPITGKVYVDTNQNGILDNNESGYSVGDTQVEAYSATSGILAGPVNTDSSGNYTLNVDSAATNFYVLLLGVPTGYTPTYPGDSNAVPGPAYNIASLPTSNTYNFGIVSSSNTLVVHGIALCQDPPPNSIESPTNCNYEFISKSSFAGQTFPAGQNYDNNSVYLIADDILDSYDKGLRVQICDNSNFGVPCLDITPTLLNQYPTTIRGGLSLNLVGFDFKVSSILISQSGAPPPPPPPGPPAPPPPSGGPSDHLNPGEHLVPGQKLVSPSGNWELDLQGQGNVVLYDCSSGSCSSAWSNQMDLLNFTPQSLEMQNDGNLVEYDSAGQARWIPLNQSGITLDPGSSLWLQDGILVLYDSSNNAIWAASPGDGINGHKP